jgi:hypothetical protein
VSWLPGFYDVLGGAWFVMVPRVGPGCAGFMAYASYN